MCMCMWHVHVHVHVHMCTCMCMCMCTYTAEICGSRACMRTFMHIYMCMDREDDRDMNFT